MMTAPTTAPATIAPTDVDGDELCVMAGIVGDRVGKYVDGLVTG